MTACDRNFLRSWVAANAVAELVGLGAVALLGLYIFGDVEQQTRSRVIASAMGLVALGAIEGLIVGAAQARVLRRRIPDLRGWILATIIGALLAWTVGMIPSTLMNIRQSGGGSQPPALGMPIIFLGAHVSSVTANLWLVASIVGLALLVAGAVVGAVHGRALLYLLRKS